MAETPDETPAVEAPKPPAPTWRFVAGAILVVGALVYLLAFGLHAPKAPAIFSAGDKKDAGAKVVTWPGCMAHGGFGSTLTNTLILCHDGSLVTIR
jgi:hypothetical protein